MVVRVELADAKSGRVVETITGTRRHPFSVEGKGFVPAGALAIGNSIVTRAGPPLVVKSVTWKRRAEGYKVYNFVVEDDHTYFVGKANGGAWVHNIECAQGGLFEQEATSAPTNRGDLRTNMGTPPEPGAEAHHELPWEHKDDFFKGPGINVNDAEYGQWTTEAGHDAIHSAGYNAKWGKWLQDHLNATKQEALDLLNKIRRSKQYGGHYL